MVTSDRFSYVGAFRLPRTASNGDWLSFGGNVIAYHPRGTLYVVSRNGNVCEVSIPPLVNSSVVGDLAFASYIQPLTPLGPRPVGSAIAGLIVDGDSLTYSATIYYDANNTQRQGHGRRSSDLSQPAATSLVSVGDPLKQGFIAGYMAPIPLEWQPQLGRAITGMFGTPVVHRTSLGPAAFSFDPSLTSLSTTSLICYDISHPTLGEWKASNEVYGGTTQAGGAVIIDDTMLFVGRNGMGAFGYGPGLADPNDPRIGTTVPGAAGETYCYDPSSPDKGGHAYPYRHQVWAYPLSDVVSVVEGELDPWEPIPTVWGLTLPIEQKLVRIGGATYDPINRLLYVSQFQADVDGFSSRALIHAFHVAPPPVVVPPDPITRLQEQMADVLRRLDILEGGVL